MGAACTAHHFADWNARHLAPQGALHSGMLAHDFRTSPANPKGVAHQWPFSPQGASEVCILGPGLQACVGGSSPGKTTVLKWAC